MPRAGIQLERENREVGPQPHIKDIPEKNTQKTTRKGGGLPQSIMGEKWVRSYGTLIRTIPSFEDGTQLRNALKPIPFVRKRESIK